jgi:hypothetical protein
MRDANGYITATNAIVKEGTATPAKVFAGNDTSIAVGQPIQLFARDLSKPVLLNLSGHQLPD